MALSAAAFTPQKASSTSLLQETQPQLRTPVRDLRDDEYTTPVHVTSASFEPGAGNSTHQSVDGYLLRELEGKLLIDIPEFQERFVLPAPDTTERVWLETTAANVNRRLLMQHGPEYWVVPSWGNDEYLPWLGERLQAICKTAHDVLKPTGAKAQPVLPQLPAAMAALSIGDSAASATAAAGEHSRPNTRTDMPPDLDVWRRRLLRRTWTTGLRTVMKDSLPKRSVDIIMSASPTETDSWTSALFLGEHKSSEAITTATVATQLAGYVSNALGAQSFRHFFHGCTVLPGTMRLWRFDRSGGLASSEFSIATEDADARKTLIEVVLAYTLMDDIRLGFDPDIYGDAECTKPCKYTARLDANGCWQPDSKGNVPEFYIHLEPLCRDLSGDNTLALDSQHVSSGESETYRLLQRIFIRSGVACRGTVCFRASDKMGQACTIKFSWRYDTLTAEGVLLGSLASIDGIFGVVRVLNHDEKRSTREIRQGIMEGERLILIKSTETKTEDTKDTGGSTTAPTARPPQPPRPLTNRIFTRTVLRDVGRPLQSARTPLELIQSMLGAFIGHGTLYHDGHILHRDISLSNVLIADELPGPGPSPILSQLRGFVIDLDYSVTVDADRLTASSSGAPHRTGTLPFMAIEILSHPDAVHLYHHDVESFLYVLIWMLTYEYKQPDKPKRVTVGGQTSKEPPPPVPTALRRSARLASLASSSISRPATRYDSEFADNWIIDRTFHTYNTFDPLVKWRILPETAMAGAKSVMLSTEHDFLHLLGFIRPRFRSPPVIALLKAMRRALFISTMRDEFGSREIFTTPIQRGLLENLEMRKVVERRLFEEVKTAMSTAIEELKAMEDAGTTVQ